MRQHWCTCFRQGIMSPVRMEKLLTFAQSIAGGETTSTFLAGVTYYLMRTPAAYAALKAEIRNAFEKYKDINASSAQKLPYLQAVIAEGLRMYPPGSQGFPRISPGTSVDGFWVPEGASHPKPCITTCI